MKKNCNILISKLIEIINLIILIKINKYQKIYIN